MADLECISMFALFLISYLFHIVLSFASAKCICVCRAFAVSAPLLFLSFAWARSSFVSFHSTVLTYNVGACSDLSPLKCCIGLHVITLSSELARYFSMSSKLLNFVLNSANVKFSSRCVIWITNGLNDSNLSESWQSKVHHSVFLQHF